MSVPALSERVQGRLVLPTDRDYDHLRRVYNGMIDVRPAGILYCATPNDVQLGVVFARSHDLTLAIRGSGHNVAGLGVVEDGLVLDLSNLRQVSVEPDQSIARAAAGVTWEELDLANDRYGLACTGGTVPDTGISGLTLGGGLGWLMGVAGLACDNLLEVKLVDAEGQMRTVSDNEDADLMWALRGGGGNFGIVTEFSFNLHRIEEVTAGSLVFPVEDALAVLNLLANFYSRCDPWAAVSPSLVTAGDGQKVLSVDFCFTLDKGPSYNILARLSEKCHVIKDTIKRQRYSRWQLSTRQPFRRGLRSYWKSLSLNCLEARFNEDLVRSFMNIPSSSSMVYIDHIHGQAARPSRPSSFDLRDRPFSLLLVSNWKEREDDHNNLAWTRETYEQLSTYAVDDGAYVNNLSQDDTGKMSRVFPRNWERLREVKQTHDPENVFHVNHNIPPTQSMSS